MAPMSHEPIRTCPRGSFLATVSANLPICQAHYLLRLRMGAFPATRPGQFVQLQCRHPRPQISARLVDWSPGHPPRFTQPELTGREPFLRRPFSLAGRRDAPDGVELEIIYRLVGAGTHWLAGVAAGEELSILGPLGNSFRIGRQAAAAVVGGGVGIPPMVYLAEALAQAGKRVVSFNGVRTAGMLPLTLVPSAKVDATGRHTFCVAEFARHGIGAAIATDDGSLGASGMVSELFRRWLDGEAGEPQELVVYACGPEPMMRAVGELCVSRGIECQLAMERHMACGMGTCQSCVVKIRDDGEQGWSFRLCCKDGPVFVAQDIVWDSPPRT